MNSEIRLKLIERYNQLESLRLAASTLNAAYPLITSEQRAANSSRMLTSVIWIGRLRPSSSFGSSSIAGGESWQRLEKGEITPKQWLDTADIHAAVFLSVLKSLGEENVISRFWNEIAIESGKDAVQVVTKTGEALERAAGGAGLGVGLVVAAIVAFKVLK